MPIHPSPTDSLLLAAVESGSYADVRAAIAQGAVPNNARKLVTLFAGYAEDGGRWKTGSDTVVAEGVLAVAIRNGDSDLVAELIRAGADPSLPISWQLPATATSWTSSTWSDRWPTWRSFTFPSALDMAISCSGNVFFNKPGGKVTYNNPREINDVCVTINVKPSVEVVRGLVNGGASVTERHIERASDLKDQSIFRLLDAHRKSGGSPSKSSQPASTGFKSPTPAAAIPAHPIVPLGPSPATARSAEPSATSTRTTHAPGHHPADPSLLTLADHLSKHISASSNSPSSPDTRLLTALQLMLADVQRSISDHHSRLIALEEDNSVLVARVEALEIGGSESGFTRPRRVVRGTRAFQPQAGDELPIAVDDEVFWAEGYADGWGNGYNLSTLRSGYFPLSYTTASASAVEVSVVNLPVTEIWKFEGSYALSRAANRIVTRLRFSRCRDAREEIAENGTERDRRGPSTRNPQTAPPSSENAAVRPRWGDLIPSEILTRIISFMSFSRQAKQPTLRAVGRRWCELHDEHVLNGIKRLFEKRMLVDQFDVGWLVPVACRAIFVAAEQAGTDSDRANATLTQIWADDAPIWKSEILIGWIQRLAPVATNCGGFQLIFSWGDKFPERIPVTAGARLIHKLRISWLMACLRDLVIRMNELNEDKSEQMEFNHIHFNIVLSWPYIKVRESPLLINSPRPDALHEISHGLDDYVCLDDWVVNEFAHCYTSATFNRIFIYDIQVKREMEVFRAIHSRNVSIGGKRRLSPNYALYVLFLYAIAETKFAARSNVADIVHQIFCVIHGSDSGEVLHALSLSAAVWSMQHVVASGELDAVEFSSMLEYLDPVVEAWRAKAISPNFDTEGVDPKIVKLLRFVCRKNAEWWQSMVALEK
ncbi:hypothetical protein HDU93_005428 [Gonapodya sp. JEL0774]|nr:hypothetical protein HDU93_005428 [Gonapodya sp. JEL0774]